MSQDTSDSSDSVKQLNPKKFLLFSMEKDTTGRCFWVSDLVGLSNAKDSVERFRSFEYAQTSWVGSFSFSMVTNPPGFDNWLSKRLKIGFSMDNNGSTTTAE